jgi:NAD(P)H-hydrate repair Nnr-like enzyme with NAD(P)H-hydrate dehydratase domain
LLTDRTAPTLLTPHDREYERFGRPVGSDRIGAARRLAEELGVHVLLKGDATVVVGPSGSARVNLTGSSLLATAGTGDVLAGGIGALLARGLPVLDAASVGAFLHGRAAVLSTGGVTTSAGLVLEAWPAAVREALLPD